MKARLPAEYQNKGAANMNQMIKQAQKMQDDIAAVQEKLDETEFSVSAGGGQKQGDGRQGGWFMAFIYAGIQPVSVWPVSA